MTYHGDCECGCGQPAQRRFIRGHNRRVYGPPRAAAPLFERFVTKFRVSESGCWEWTGGKCGNGYGNMFLRKESDGRTKRIYAHRVSYEHFVGPIPDGLELDHLCRNRGCVNPEHLEPVTRGENLRRIPQEARPPHMQPRTHCKRGHEFTPENTGVNSKGRFCRTCRKASQ